MTSFQWDHLLDLIEEEKIVPFVGQDLLKVRLKHEIGADREVFLYSYLAEALAEKLGLKLEARPQSLHEVACAYLSNGSRDLEEIYHSLRAVMPPPDKIDIPQPLLQLAGINKFKFFVTTTFDSLLEQAINQVRFNGEARTKVLTYAPNASTHPRPAESRQLREATVFHLFGKLSAAVDYAVTEEDILEFVHSLQSESNSPEILFDELRGKHLLILGNSFAEWLARFFLRIAMGQRLWGTFGRTDFVADEKVHADQKLKDFLRSFSSRTRIYEGTAIDFVHQLRREWDLRHPELAAPPPKEPAPFPGMQKGAIFLSYAREDLEVVERIQKALEEAKLDTWFDLKDMELGEPWERKIWSTIRRCSLFVPILSRHSAAAKGQRFFRVEWRQASRIAEWYDDRVPFITPVVIDDKVSPLDIELSFKKIAEASWFSLRSGENMPELVRILQELYRENRRLSGGDL